jgi:hypothetical protein
MVITLENTQVNLNETYPIQQFVNTEKIKFLPLKGSTNITILFHWYDLLGAPSCDACQFENRASVRIKLFTDSTQWDSDAKVGVYLSHRQRAVTIADFVEIAVSNPVNPVGRAEVATSSMSTPTNTNRIETTTVTVTAQDASTDKISSNAPQLPLSNFAFFSLLVIAAFQVRRVKKKT